MTEWPDRSFERRYARLLETRRRERRDRLVSAAGLLRLLAVAPPLRR